MVVWIVLGLVGLLSLAWIMWRTARAAASGKALSGASLALGIAFPVVVLVFFSATLLDLFPGLTIIDTGALFAVGMVSGFFLGVYVLQRRQQKHGDTHQ